MKKIITIAAAAISMLALVSCEHKAQFMTADIITLDANRMTVKEDVGTIKIPVTLISDVTKTVPVTYTVTDGTALAGKHYNHKNTSGVISVSNNPAVECDSIVVDIIDSTGVLTKNKEFVVELKEVADDAVHMGNTTKCTVTIIDVDGGINLIVGTWIGTSPDGVSCEWIFDVYDPSAEEDPWYPEANIKICAGSTLKDKPGNSWEYQVDVYGVFNEDTSEITFYNEQPFDGGNFGDPVGEAYVSMDNFSYLASGADEGVIFSVGSGVMSLKTKFYLSLYNISDDDEYVFTGYGCGAVETMTLTQN